ncbi:MAG: DUF2029 domain-containing protein [Planctomycetes bacterium]|nr:DUF2029 domain-containing protein [Planctomycetota bacterium]
MFLTLGAALEMVLLLWLGLSPRFAHELPGDTAAILSFMALYGLAFLIYVAAVAVVAKGGGRLWAIIFFAVLFRVTLLPSFQVLENDLYRYLWDGKVLAHGHNPYLVSPADVERPEESCHPSEARALHALAKQDERPRHAFPDLGGSCVAPVYPPYFDWIGHRAVPTIYPPLAETVFALAYLIDPGNLYVMKALFVLFDLLTLWLLIASLPRLGLSVNWCLLYAWSPLVLKEFANSGHLDSLPVFLVTLAFYLLMRSRPIWASVTLALGCLSKLYPVLLLPVFIRRLGWKGVAVFALVVAAGYAPFLGIGLGSASAGLRTYAAEWEFNSSLFYLCYSLVFDKLISAPLDRGGRVAIDALAATKLLMTGILAAIVCALCAAKARRAIRKQPESDLDLAWQSLALLGALLLLSPVTNAWYLAMLFPFLCVWPMRSWILLSGLIVLAYAFHLPPEDFARAATRLAEASSWLSFLPADADTWRAILWFHVRWLEYVPFYALLAWEGLTWPRRRPPATKPLELDLPTA